MSKLTVVIPSKNIDNLAACIEAVRKHEPNVRLIVVDDGIEWEDEESRIKRHWREHDIVLKGIEPFCFARNVNLGIKEAGTADVILLNDDALLKTPSGFGLLQQAAAENGEFGVIAAVTNNVNNRRQQQQGVGLRQEPKMVCFVAVFISRATIDAVGLLDERFVGYVDNEKVYGGEDDEMCYRVRAAGLKIGIHDGVFVDHGSLRSTFRPHGGGLPINATRKRFQEIHGFAMGSR